MQLLKEYIWSNELKNQGRMNIKSFVRERILTFPVLVLFFINFAKKSLQVSLNEFCKVSDLLSVTKQAFSKSRKNLSSQVFILLNRKLLEEYFTDNQLKTWNGFRLVAIDGSDIQVPQTKKLADYFGRSENQNGPGIAMAKISYAYDVLNNLTLDAQIDRFKTSERNLAIKHIEAIQKLEHDPIKDLYIFDRGYPSLGFLFYLFDQKKDFLIRATISTCFAKIQKALEEGKQDAIIRFYANEASDEQIKDLKMKVPLLDRKSAYIDVRFVIVILSTGEKELLITSLVDQKKYPKEEFKTLYGTRWGAEENYKWHKGAFELENFSGQTVLSVEQDLFSLVFTANLSSLLIQEAQEELDEEYKNKALKHTYKINKCVAIATIKNILLKAVLDPNIDIEMLCNHLKIGLKKSVCPVRPNRQFSRPKKSRLKHGCTTRRCI